MAPVVEQPQHELRGVLLVAAGFPEAELRVGDSRRAPPLRVREPPVQFHRARQIRDLEVGARGLRGSTIREEQQEQRADEPARCDGAHEGAYSGAAFSSTRTDSKASAYFTRAWLPRNEAEARTTPGFV